MPVLNLDPSKFANIYEQNKHRTKTGNRNKHRIMMENQNKCHTKTENQNKQLRNNTEEKEKK
jgi:hypothetical protein